MDKLRSPAPGIAVPRSDELSATYRGQIAVFKIFDFFTTDTLQNGVLKQVLRFDAKV